MNSISAALLDLRQDGQRRAAAELERLGFANETTGWTGTLRDGGNEAEVKIRLPGTFPDSLPQVYLRRPAQHPAFAHVERTGKLCLAADTGTFIDASQPERLVDETLSRAKKVLFPDPQAHAEALQEEFVSYWPDNDALEMLSLCPVPLALGAVAVQRVGNLNPLLAAPTRAAAEAWATRSRMRLGADKGGFAIPMGRYFDPPRFTDRLNLTDLLALLDANADTAHVEAFRNWLSRTGLPAHVLLSVPRPDTLEAVVAAVVRGESGRNGERWQHGFRPGRAPKSRQISLGRSAPVARLGVRRLDPQFLIERGGGNPLLVEKTVVVVGCGAVGAHAAILVAASGVGQLRLIDPDRLGSENVQRHALGMSDIGEFKVHALKTYLQGRFPHLEVVAEAKDVLTVVEEKPNLLTDEADALLIAVGDETLERRLNDLLPRELKRVHVWLEPLGVGGHVLACGLPFPGCYSCLFRTDEIHGLVNQSSLVAPAQVFQRTMGGCAGTFTPFGQMDAVRAASEGATAVVNLLTGKTTGPHLYSWVTDTTAILDGGYRLSAVGRSLTPGTSRRVEQFATGDCEVCR